MKKFIWLSYDLGIGGDYESLYSWLDNHEAKECGDSVACLWFTYKGDFIEELKVDLDEKVSPNKRSRIYVAYRDNDKLKGVFIFGRRKQAAWEGYGAERHQYEDVG